MLFLVNTITLARVISQEKINTRQPDGKIKVKQPLFVDDMILYTENPKGFTFKKLLEQMSLARMQDIRSIYKDQLHFYTLAANTAKMNRIPFIILSKRTSPWWYSG